MWLKERTTWNNEHKPDAQTRAMTAYKDYQDWAPKAGKMPSLTSFGTALVALKVPKAKTTLGVMYSFGLLLNHFSDASEGDEAPSDDYGL